MTGKLHLPVPALIAAGPLYRGGGLFMAILFSASVLLVGPAWCSWLCYIGAWDDRCRAPRRSPARCRGWRPAMRIIVLVLVMGAAFALGRLGVGTFIAGWLAAGFGLVGVGLMVFWSRRTGHMTHCTAYCPMGWVATRLGKVSPWRLKIADALHRLRRLHPGLPLRRPLSRRRPQAHARRGLHPVRGLLEQLSHRQPGIPAARHGSHPGAHHVPGHGGGDACGLDRRGAAVGCFRDVLASLLRSEAADYPETT